MSELCFSLLFAVARSLLMSLQRTSLINIFLFHFLCQSSFSTFQITALKAQVVQCKAFKNEPQNQPQKSGRLYSELAGGAGKTQEWS